MLNKVVMQFIQQRSSSHMWMTLLLMTITQIYCISIRYIWIDIIRVSSHNRFTIYDSISKGPRVITWISLFIRIHTSRCKKIENNYFTRSYRWIQLLIWKSKLVRFYSWIQSKFEWNPYRIKSIILYLFFCTTDQK